MKERAHGSRGWKLRTALVVLTLGAAMSPAPALATNCVPRTGQSPCFDADQLWVPAAPSRFVAIPRARAAPAGSYSVGLDATYLSRPVVLQTLSPDPDGREVRAVDDVVDAALSTMWVPRKRLELTLVVPFALYRSGTSESAATSQRGPALESSALRDIRISAAHDLLESRIGTASVGVMSRLEVALPTGDESAFAGDRDPVVAPSLSGGVRAGKLYGGALLGARLRRPVEIGGQRLGTEIVSVIGIGVSVVPHLDLALEAWALPSPLSQERTFRDGVRVTDGSLVPAEWMLSARSTWGDLQVQGGFGTAIPLSTETRRSPSGAEAVDQFAGVGTPRFRATLGVRFAPGALP